MIQIRQPDCGKRHQMADSSFSANIGDSGLIAAAKQLTKAAAYSRCNYADECVHRQLPERKDDQR